MSAILDLGMAQRFCDALELNGEFTFFCKGEGASSGLVIPRELQGTFASQKEQLADLNYDGAGVYVTVNRTDLTGRKTHCITSVRAVFADIDQQVEEADLSFPIKPHLVVETSPKRWHAYWLVKDLAKEDFKAMQQAIALSLGSDPAVCDLPRVMRLPGYIHQKGEPFLSRIASANTELLPYSKEELITGFGGSPVAAPSLVATESTVSSESSMVSVGERNASLMRLAGSLRRLGMPKDELEFALHGFNRKICQPPLPEAEILAVLESVMRYPVVIASLSDTLTDTGNAERFANHWHESLRYVPKLKTWMQWNGDSWKIDESGLVQELAKQTANLISAEADAIRDPDMAKAVKRHARSSLNRRKLIDMVETAASIPRLQVEVGEIDADKMLLGVTNGGVELATGSFRAIRFNDYLTKRAAVSFDPAAACPVFEQFVRRILGDDDELVSFVQRAIGYTLTGRVDEQCLFFLHGSGANGKSTFLNALRDVLGDYSIYTAPETLMPRGGTGASPSSDLARLRGARLVLSNEVEEGSHMAENLVKQVTGGDPIVARYLHKEFFEFQPQLKLWIAGNHLPVVKGNDEGIWRRIKLIPFNVTIPAAERDPDLPRKLLAESAGILNWAIQGCLDWQKMGLRPPAVVTGAVREYRDEMDIIGQWLDDECVIDPGKSIRAQLLYDNYRTWAEKGGYRPMSQNAFARKLETRGVATKRRTSSGRVYDGLDLREITPEDLLAA